MVWAFVSSIPDLLTILYISDTQTYEYGRFVVRLARFNRLKLRQILFCCSIGGHPYSREGWWFYFPALCYQAGHCQGHCCLHPEV